MIPVKPKPEPDTFDQLVRVPGNRFLKKVSNSKLTNKQWEYHDYWTNIRPYIYDVYNRVCAYYAHWIPNASCTPNVDHFIPKSVRPELAYEWSNYRLACPRANSLKRDFQDVLDPFEIEENWFVLDFPSLLVRPNPKLTNEIQEQIWKTIDRLKLNDDQTIVDERSRWLEYYCQGKTDLSFLKENAPFIAHELKRQNLVEDIKKMMVFVIEEED